MKYIFCGLLFLAVVLPAVGQVTNDNIENRILLELNTPVQSNTIGSTVQWNCLNQDLTRSCIKYHNDQWFVFSAPTSGKFYINVSAQDCRDIWGVQVLVFAGKPCQPESYELITCYSDGNKDDVFITLEGLNPGEYYLLNIDGYLNDQCSFALEVSDKPKGLPVLSVPIGESESQTDLRNVKLTWRLPDSVASKMRTYEVWRESDDRSVLITKVPHSMNAFGENQLEYHSEDTLYTSRANYSIIGVSDEDRILIAKETVVLNQEELARAPENIISLNLDYSEGDALSLELWDADNDKLLFTRAIEFDPERNGEVQFRVKYYREQGVKFFKVIIRNRTTRKSELRFFEK